MLLHGKPDKPHASGGMPRIEEKILAQLKKI
jgi:hypothetical protein